MIRIIVEVVVLLVITVFISSIVECSITPPTSSSSKLRLMLENVRVDISKLPTTIENIKQNNIVDIRRKTINTISDNIDNLIPRNYQILENLDNTLIDNSKSNLDLKTESIPFGLEAFLGITSCLLLDTLLPLEIIFTAESIFLIYMTYIRSAYIDKPKIMNDSLYDREWEIIWNNTLESVEDPRQWFASWFLGQQGTETIQFDDIKIEDAMNFVCWAMYQRTPEQLDFDQRFALDKAIKQIEYFTKSSFSPREPFQAPIASMRASLEVFKGFHKPLGFYLLTQGVSGFLMENELKSSGFDSDASIKPFRYFIKKPDDSDTASFPVIFFHGVGGLASYIPLIKSLMNKISRNHPIILIEMPYVSLHVAPTVPSVEEHVSLVKEVLNKNGYSNSKYILMGHSWGSNPVSWLTQADYSKVAACLFLDPVCFNLHLKDITYNWFYKQKENPTNLIKSVMGLVKTEPFSVNTLQRNLVWFRNIIWPAELQQHQIKTCIIVSSDDHIVPSKEIIKTIFQHNSENPTSCIEIHELENADHGGMVFDEVSREKTAMIMAEMCLQID